MALLRLDGPDEPFSDTLRYHVARHLAGPAPGIEVLSASGHAGSAVYDAATKRFTDNDWAARKNKDVLYLYEGGSVREDADSWRAGTVRKVTPVYLLLTVTGAKMANIAQAELDVWVAVNLPNNALALVKSDGRSSGILTFDRQALDWTQTGSPVDRRTVLSYASEIGCVHQPA